ncbi:MAG: acyl carrier protein [Paludibacteraceae bacterium]|nr:acyl carrier protein [Paludibacteraceae bacterium]
MKEKVLEVINMIRVAKNLPLVESVTDNTRLREDLDLTSFDMAELTVRIEDEYGIDIFETGLVNTIGEIYAKLQK